MESNFLNLALEFTRANPYSAPWSAIYDWQELMGSFIGGLIGAVTALGLFLANEKGKKKEEMKNHWHLLHRSIGAALTNLADIDSTLHRFVKEQLKEMIAHVEGDIKNGVPSVGQAFIPLTHVTDISDELLKKFSGSGYVDVKTMILVNRSKDWRKIMDDIDRQFDRTLTLNTQIALSGVNIDHANPNKGFKKNLENFRTYITEQIFDNNLPLYVRELIQGQVAIGKLMELEPKKWTKLFKDKNIRPESMVEDMDKFFIDEVNERIKKYQEAFVSKLKPLQISETKSLTS